MTRRTRKRLIRALSAVVAAVLYLTLGTPYAVRAQPGVLVQWDFPPVS